MFIRSLIFIILYIMIVCIIGCTSVLPNRQKILSNHGLRNIGVYMQMSKLVIIGERVSEPKGSKYLWIDIRIVKTLKNEDEVDLETNTNIRVGYLSWKPLLPKGKHKIFLIPYGVQKQKWRMIAYIHDNRLVDLRDFEVLKAE